MTTKLSRTKIVCTLGPASSNKEVLEKMVDAGMNVARLNFSHGEYETHAQNIALLRQIQKDKGKHIALLQDLQGPKIRVGKLKEGKLLLHKGQTVTLRYGVEQDSDVIPIDYKELVGDIKIGERILIDDGLMAMTVTDMQGQDVICEVTQGGVLKSRKGVNFPDCVLSIPSITEKDTKDLLFGISQRVDFIALSFVRYAADVLKLKNIIKALGAEIPVVSKIEMLSAVDHIDDICRVSDAIMVARGDLGVECGFANVSAYQKIIVDAARKAGKPVIVATQMLDSMIENSRPTKAEISDVANAVFDLADATMLSGETASGAHPILSVQTMRAILDEVDASSFLKEGDFEHLSETSPLPEIIADTVAKITATSEVKAIVCLTLTGQIAKSIAKYRLKTPIIAVTPRPDVARKLSLVRNVHSVLTDVFFNTDEALSLVGPMLKQLNIVHANDLVLVTGGIPVSEMHPTNSIKLYRVPT